MKALTELLELFIVITIILILFTIEGLIAYSLTLIEFTVMGDFWRFFNKSWRFLFALIWFRILLCTLLQLLLYAGLGKRFISDENLLPFSIFNVFTFFVVTSIVLVFMEGDYFEWNTLRYFFVDIFTRYFIIATFLSPLILNRLPILRELLTKWSKMK